MKPGLPAPRTLGDIKYRTWAGASLLFLAGTLAYLNSFHVPFVYDDQASLLTNPSIQHLWPIWKALWVGDPGLTVSARPVANLSFAINYAISGHEVWSYHLLNLLIHLTAGLALFGIVRRTLQLPILRARFGPDAYPLAFLIALLWTLHPLHVEAVTYTVQRVESMMGMFYFLTLYGFIRAAETDRPIVWNALMFTACFLGMGTKEVMVSAPVLVLLYARTFLTGSFVSAWRLHKKQLLGLASTWLFLLAMVASAGWNRGGASGFDVGVTPMDYWLTQPLAIVRYLGLAFWPHPLIFEYGTFYFHDVASVLPFAALLSALVAMVIVALWRWPAMGFLGFWFFAILAPTSVIPGTVQMIVEHRMYLALAAVIAPAVLGLYLIAGRRSWYLLVPAAVVLGLLTAQRNSNYRSELELWKDTVAKRPTNVSAVTNYGLTLDQTGNFQEAIQQLREAVRINPKHVKAQNDLGLALEHNTQYADALVAYSEAVKLAPNFPDAHYNRGNVLVRLNRLDEAIGEYETALKLKPDLAPAHYNLAVLLDQKQRFADAIEHYEAALRIAPENAEAHAGLGAVLEEVGRSAEARDHQERALQLAPDSSEAHYNMGNILSRDGRSAEAIEHYQAALRIRPSYPEVHYNWANTLVQLGRWPEAIEHYQAALQLRPEYAEAHNNLGVALGQTGHLKEAVSHFQAALRLKPDYPGARENLERAMGLTHRTRNE